MQFRFIEFDEESNKDKLVGYSDIEDYDIAFKMFTYMKEHECELSVMVNTEDIADTEGDYYIVKNVYFVTPKLGGQILPYICVDIEKWL